MKCTTFFCIFVLFAAAVQVTRDQSMDKTADLTLGNLDIRPDVYLEINNNTMTLVGGAVNNSGSFYVNLRNRWAASVRMVCGSIENRGNMAFNSMAANLASRYKITSIGRFVNSGNIWMGTVLARFNPFTPFEITSYTDWRNEGKMHFATTSGAASPVVLSQTAGNGVRRIHNNGNICFQNSIFSQRTRISGAGCLNALDNGVVKLQASHFNAYGAFDPNQVVALHDLTSRLEVAGLTSVFFHETPVINVGGFGNGNKIKINSTFTSFTYDAGRGHLTLQLTPIMKITFNIGQGYDRFVTNQSLGFATEIWTHQPPPGPLPQLCDCETFPRTPSDQVTPQHIDQK